MNIDLTTKPQVIFSLPPILEAYCRFIFSTPERQKEIIINRRHDIGKLIFAYVMNGDIRFKQPLMDHPVTFILPMPSNEHGYWLRYRYIYVPRWAEEKINDGIEYEFRSWVKDRFRIGYDIEEVQQKTIINAILRGLNVRKNVANYDTIKKIDDRNARKKQEIMFKRLITIEKSEL